MNYSTNCTCALITYCISAPPFVFKLFRKVPKLTSGCKQFISCVNLFIYGLVSFQKSISIVYRISLASSIK